MADDEEVKVEEVVQPEQQVESAGENDQKEEESSQKTPVVKDKEYNFAELRKAKEAAERERDYERQRNQEMFDLIKQSKQQPAPQQERDLLEEELSKLSKDDLATIDNVDKKLTRAQKYSRNEVDSVKKELAEMKAQLEEQKFRTKYPDLDEVVSVENIAALKKEDPEIADIIGSLPSGSKEQVIMAYKYIKRLVPEKTPDGLEKRKAMENSKKPVSVQAVAKTSPIGMAHAFENGLTPDLKKALYKEMQEAMKRQ